MGLQSTSLCNVNNSSCYVIYNSWDQMCLFGILLICSSIPNFSVCWAYHFEENAQETTRVAPRFSNTIMYAWQTYYFSLINLNRLCTYNNHSFNTDVILAQRLPHFVVVNSTTFLSYMGAYSRPNVAIIAWARMPQGLMSHKSLLPPRPLWPSYWKRTEFCRWRRTQYVVAGDPSIPESQGSLFAVRGRHSCLWSKATRFYNSQVRAKIGTSSHTGRDRWLHYIKNALAQYRLWVRGHMLPPRNFCKPYI